MAERWRVPDDEIVLRFTPSGGPGGQHANRAHTRVEAVFDVAGSPTMPEDLRQRVRERLGDVVRVVVDEHRSQARNRHLAVERLRSRIDAAGRVEPPRRPTRPGTAARRRRLEAKRRRSEVKRTRRRPRLED